MLLRLHKNVGTLCSKSSILVNFNKICKNEIMYHHPRLISTSSSSHFRGFGFRFPAIVTAKDDKVPQDYHLVYQNSAVKPEVVWSGLYLCGISGVVGLIKYPFISNFFSVGTSIVTSGNILAGSLFMLGHAYALALLIQRVPIRIYFNEDEKKFLAVNYSLIPLKTEQHMINMGEMQPPQPFRIFFHYFPDMVYAIPKSSGKKFFVMKSEFRPQLLYRVFVYNEKIRGGRMFEK